MSSLKDLTKPSQKFDLFIQSDKSPEYSMNP